MDKNGNLYFVLLNPLAIVCWDSSTSYKTDNIKMLYRNDETMQFAGGVKIVTNMVGDEELWLVTNRLQVRNKFFWMFFWGVWMLCDVKLVVCSL